jgi:hypothetical protein
MASRLKIKRPNKKMANASQKSKTQERVLPRVLTFRFAGAFDPAALRTATVK